MLQNIAVVDPFAKNDLTVHCDLRFKETIDDLYRFRKGLTETLSELEGRRRSLRNKFKRDARAGNEDGKAKTRAEIEEVSAEMAKIRKLLRLSDTIEERSKRMSRGLTELQDEDKKEEQSEQLFERGSRTGNEDIPGRD